jgi:hypothetical protein
MYRIALACAALLLCGSAANADVIINWLCTECLIAELPASTVGGVTLTSHSDTTLTGSVAAGTGVPGVYSLGAMSFKTGGAPFFAVFPPAMESINLTGILDGTTVDLHGSINWFYEFPLTGFVQLTGSDVSIEGIINLGIPVPSIPPNETRTVGISGGFITVPGPELGAGLPGMLSACGALWYLARRKRLSRTTRDAYA